MSPVCCSPMRPRAGPVPGPALALIEARDGVRLLDLDARARGLQLLPRLVSLLLRDLFEDRLGRAIDEILGFLQPEARQCTHLLDDLDLLVAGSRQDHVELRLLLRLFASCGGARG